MSIKGSERARKALSQLKKFGNRKLMGDLGDKAIEIIIKRTVGKGIDVKHRPFTPYSKGYKKKRGQMVNLRLSGQMLNAMSRQVLDGHTVRIYIEDSSRKGQSIDNNFLAWVHNDGGRSGKGKGFNMPKREFFWIENKRELIKIERLIVEHIMKIIGRL